MGITPHHTPKHTPTHTQTHIHSQMLVLGDNPAIRKQCGNMARKNFMQLTTIHDFVCSAKTANNYEEQYEVFQSLQEIDVSSILNIQYVLDVM